MQINRFIFIFEEWQGNMENQEDLKDIYFQLLAFLDGWLVFY